MYTKFEHHDGEYDAGETKRAAIEMKCRGEDAQRENSCAEM